MKEVELSFEYEDKTKITKKVPENLASLYLKQGWKVVDTKSKKEEKTRFGTSEKD